MGKRYAFLTCLFAAMLFVAPLAVADTLEPGGSVDLLDEGGMCSTVVSVDPTADPAVTASADCDEELNVLLALAGIDELIDTDGDASASAVLTYMFEVDGQDGAGNTIAGQVSYGILWSGLLEATTGAADVSITVGIYELTSAKGSTEVAEVTVHENSTPGDDTGSADASFPVELVRGEQYAVVVELHTAASIASTMEAETVLSDFFEDPNGATIDALSVSAEFDIAALVEQVLQNTSDIATNRDNIEQNAADIEANAEAIAENSAAIDENAAAIDANAAAIAANTSAIEANANAIAANTQAIETLATALAAVIEVLEDLRDDFQGHTHTYLTGRGQGHNNTEATTTAPPPDDTPPEPVPLGSSATAKRPR